MPEFSFRKGLDLPITGAPEQVIHPGPQVGSVALVGPDYLGLKPRMLVAEGDAVDRGTPLFCDKDSPEVVFVSPVTGRVGAINRGDRRVLESVVIEVTDAAAEGVDFGVLPQGAGADEIAARICAAGLWTGFRARPYSRIPAAGDRPAAIYVTAMDTEPLSPDAAVVIGERGEDFTAGLAAIAKLAEGHTYLCHAPGAAIPSVAGVVVATFAGPHPAGLAGTHMHFLEPPSNSKTVWSIGYQDVLAIGALMRTGRLNPERVIAISGPRAANPRLVRTLAGAALNEILAGEAAGEAPLRVISGSVLTGRHSEGTLAYLGRYARAVTLITEDREQILFGWIAPQSDKFAQMPVLASARDRLKKFQMGTNLNGSRRAMVPTGVFEELMPQDLLPTQLLRALLVMDTDTAQSLGALELDEEDLALCTFACPAKYEYGAALRDCLAKIEKEG
ncbi:Na(+)-translocating NADH-quinone reductase subunit A [Tropicimonas sp. IMCC34043]|uniref:Na(+)-translocating NADH-quinone reductase subunit A n=1 Tax=Tropicimonas sp. IMCC34043 TaxID=2248760 RepID=UPI000E274642|nr:Na(+)-translocating NADH-quinone reductase subunit A [Tropicimonas sp. IMCC34043]